MSSSAPRDGQTTLYPAPLTRRSLLALTALGVTAGGTGALAGSQGQLTYGVHVSLAPAWFDPGEAAGIITPYMLLYGLHDALVKAMPDNKQAPSLAEVIHLASEDGLTHEFVLHKGATFHNGDPVTADDVKFSFERYHGASQSLLKQRVAAVETPDAQHVRFRLKEPWPDFMTFYAGVTGAAWIVPRKYMTQVGDEGFKKAPIGAGPYRFVSFTPGVELVLEAFDGYWRKTPSIKRLVMKVIPDEVHAARGSEAGRDRYRVFDPRRACWRTAADPGSQHQAGGRPGCVLRVFRGSVGSEIARGTMCGCGAPPTLRSTARRSTTR